MASLRQRALRLLAAREHTRAELTRKLSGQATQDDIALVLDALQNDGLLSDERFAASYVRTHAARLGRSRLAQTLRAKGVAADLANQELDFQLNQDGQSDELERARVLWARKFGKVPADSREWARQARFLQFRGFSSEVVRKVLRDAKLAGNQLDARAMDKDNQS
ncbi:MAG: regulatory protein RecX [Rhodocyclaceae bacterium]|nr:regulatory protein RecX [Rhodocyclaceae bacterium]